MAMGKAKMAKKKMRGGGMTKMRGGGMKKMRGGGMAKMAKKKKMMRGGMAKKEEVMPYVADSEIHGLGVFADRDYAQGDTIELCPYLVADYADVGDECVLHDYMFHTPYDGEEQYYIPLGHAMVYNHSASPNAEWDIEEEDERFVEVLCA